MIRHIVLFKMKPFPDAASRLSKLSEIKVALEDLTQKVPELLRAEAGINMNPAEDYDLSLTCDVNSMDDLEVYANHPDHVAVKHIIREVLEARACVDYEV